MPEIPAEKTLGSHSSKESPFWCQICKNDLCLHNSPFHNTYQYFCQTTALSELHWTTPCSIPIFGSLGLGKGTQKRTFFLIFVCRALYSHLPEVKLSAKQRPQEKTLGASQTGRDTTTHGIPRWKKWGEPSTEPAVLHKPTHGSLQHLWVGTNNTQGSPKKQRGIFTGYSIPQNSCTEGFCSTEQLVWEG